MASEPTAQQPPEPLRELMTQSWLPRAPSCPSEHPASGLREQRRRRLAEAFPGELLVVPTGVVKTRANDTTYPFRPGTAFTWLVGGTAPGAVLVVHPDGRALLYQDGPQSREETSWYTSYHGERYDGSREPLEDVAARLRVEVSPLADLVHLKGEQARVLRELNPAVEELFVTDSESGAALRVWLDEARLVKDSWEIEQLQEAVDITVRGFEDAVRELDRAVSTSERHLEGTFFLRARVEGNDVGYGSICASGANACTIHYTRNDAPVRDGDLLLLDMGVESRELYTADITRTFPVSGRFTDRQRWHYSLVLEAQEAALAELGPGVPIHVPYDAAMRVLVRGLQEIGVLDGDDALSKDDQRHKRWTVHRISHMLGLDVHDCAAARTQMYLEGVLLEGMVLTVEPGLYFLADDALAPEDLRGKGVRIEDDVVITADGYRLLSGGLPRSPDQVEAWMDRLREGSS